MLGFPRCRQAKRAIQILASSLIVTTVLGFYIPPPSSPIMPHCTNNVGGRCRRVVATATATAPQDSTTRPRRSSLSSAGGNRNSLFRSSHHYSRYGERTNIELMMAAGDEDDGDSNTPGLPFVLPSLSQLLSLWIVGVSSSRVYQTLSVATSGNLSDDDSSKLVANIALNGILFCGACFFLLKSIQGIDYSSLEGLDTKSLAKQAGEWALDGTIPTSLIVDQEYEVATFAGGCFWGTELHYQRIPGVIATCVGYTQGSITKPTYEQVCSGTTGHTEGIQLIYDPNICSYERLLTKLFNTINPTLLNRVGNDTGTQYRHGVYYHTQTQKEIASIAFESMQSKYNGQVVTELKPATIFWPAENYHQRYLEKGGQSAAKDCEDNVRCYG